MRNTFGSYALADLLPNELAGALAARIEQGLAAMKQTLERR